MSKGISSQSFNHQLRTTVHSLRQSDHEITNFPSGDSNTNVFSPLTTLSAYPPPLENPQPPHFDRNPEIATATVSKASGKSEDDFDVNEYFARLQGTRYVSAPINSNPDQNANLAATEENLEEINLNDEKNIDVQQSLTADIAQNFSQLPTVLPQVASAVFSSFSNMLNYKSREQTPDDRSLYQSQEVPMQSSMPPGYAGQNLAMDTPLMAEDVVKDVAPPPKEIPNSGATNFRITTKKKYAQIPGLSSGTNFETSQKIELNPLTKNVKNYFVPSNDENIFTEAPMKVVQENNNIPEQTPPKTQETYNIYSSIGDVSNRASDFQPTVFNIPKEMEPKPFEERLPPPPTTYDLHGSNAPNAAIPPPPMFSTQRPGSQTGKSVLPPSVARRIGSNHPVIKQQPMQTINTENIFVPTFDPMNYPTAAEPIGTSFSDIHSQSAFGTLVTEQPTSQSQEANMPSIPPPAQFTPGFTPPPLAQTSVIAPPSKAPPRLPPQALASPPSSMMPTNIAAPPMFAQTLPSQPPMMFVPSTAPVDGITNSGKESSLPPLSIFSPTSPTAQTNSPPGPIQPPGSTGNVAPISYFTPQPPTNDAPSFYNPIVQEQPKSGQSYGSEPPKPMIEPPKATGSVNYRMNKKRPQYYSGPIEGVGSISNSIKPVIPTVDSGTFQGALFTPEQPQGDQNLSSSVPFDLSKPAENVPLIPQYNIANPVNVQPPPAFDISQPAPGYPHFDITHHIQNPEPQYNTAFDLSRPTTDSYNQREEPKESKGFGIIGSLKSKLSSLDINKIQHSMTTFFDPAYKDVTKEETAAPVAQQNAPYSNMPYDSQSAQTNLEIFVPNAPQNNQEYNYGYQQHQNSEYLNNEYYKYPNFQNQGQPFAGHCSNSQDYPTHSKPYNTNAQQGYPDQNINTTMFQQTSAYVPTQEATATSPNDKVTTEGPLTFKENQDFNAERNMDENVARAGPEVAKLVQSTTFIEEKFATNFFDMANLGVQNPIEVPKAEVPVVAPQVSQDRTFISESFEQIHHEQTKPGPIIFNPDTRNLFTNNEKSNVYGNQPFDNTENISSYGAESKDLFAKIQTNNEILEDIQSKLLPAMTIDKKEEKEKLNDEIKTHNLFTSPVIYEGKEKDPTIPKDSLLDSLTKTDVPMLGVSSVPLFGLSTILAEKSKEYIPSDIVTSLSDKNSSMSFFDHTQKLEDYGAKHADELSRHSSFSFFENLATPTQEETANNQNIDVTSGNTSVHDCKHDIKENTPENQDKMERDQNENIPKNIGTEAQDDNASELSICETCREVNKPEDREEDQDVTNQLIENITSPLQLSNPVETTLTEADIREPTNKEQVKIDEGQFDEISHITEETIETIQVQSAAEILEEIEKIKALGFGWKERDSCAVDAPVDSRGYFDKGALFDDDDDEEPISTNETKHHEQLLVRQMSVPSAPPAEEEEEEDAKSDEAGKLDVNSIERDASKDFPLFEEYVIEPSKDDDDDPKSEHEMDSFTNRVEKYKKLDPIDGIDHQSLFFDIAPQPISMVSYFDTGNYAVEAHYRNTNTRPAPSIPPGFEEEFKRRVALAKQREEKIRNDFKTVPETSTQTRTTQVATYCSSRIAPNYTKIQSIVPVGFNIEANITSLVDEQSEPLPDFSTPPILKKAFEKKPDDQIEKIHDLRKEKKIKLPPIPNVFDPKPAEKQDSKLPEYALAPGFKPDVPEETPLPELLTAFSSKADDKIETILPPCAAFTITKPEEIPPTMMPSFSAFIATKPEENPETMPTYAPFPISEPDEITEAILPPYSAFATSKPDNKLESMLPPFAAFAASKAEESSAMIAPAFSAFKSPKPEETPAQILPPFSQFTSSKTDSKPETMLPPFAAFVASKSEEKTESALPAFSPFVTSLPDEKPATVLPPFSAFNTSKPEENSALSLPPFEIFNTSKTDEVPAKVVPTFGAFAVPKLEEKPASIIPPIGALTAIQPEEKSEQKLPDPINFFSDTTSSDPPESFSRLASYFSSPPKTEHAKSFFELSQSQNHYRHASTAEQTKIIGLMNDLTSVKNITVTKDQTVKHVNYFTVEYDTVLPDFNKLDTANEKVDYPDFDNLGTNEAVEFSDDIDVLDIDSILKNCRTCSKIFDTTFKVRTAVNEISGEQGSVNTSIMEPHKETGRGSVTVNFDGMTIQEEPNEGAASMAENRSATEYTPVKHHWFYRVDVEDKSIWRGFSVTDSRALEAANLSPDLNEHTLVATDGGRYDVNVIGRLRIPVYWEDKPTNVRRCSWFYKGTTDARYVPYTEPVAEKLEEEYRHGMTTSEWHRRLVLPNGEVVVMHGPSVMVHFLHSDAFSSPPQSSSRPRVVRRGHDESEIEDIEPSSIDHLLLLCHGVGSACDMRFRSVEEVVEDFRATSLQLVQSHYRNSYDQGVVSRVEVLPVSWHSTLHSGETGVDRRLAQITLDSIPRLRSFTNETVLDVLFYTSPVYCQTILDTVCKELNRIYELFLKRNPSFTGGVSLGGHSLGSVILYDLLCHQADIATDDTKTLADKNYVKGPAGTGQPFVRYPSLVFAPDAMYALGSPIAIFECIRGVDSLGANFSLPTCKNFFNIFHPYDPIAYRIEPLINPQLRDLKPHLIPHHKGRKRMHLELKDTMARVGADLKQKLLESLKSTWNKWKAAPPTDGQLEKVVEEELEKEQLTEDKEELAREIELSTPDNLGRLNGGRRVDYVLQEAPLEMINEYLFAMSSHVGYWESEDTMLLMLREIYSALGVQPDSTVPQQNMTVQRTRITKPDEAAAVTDFPSTSRGPI
ncbi:hypothetical protein PYW07_012680 [Mythimna separata]|uniref:Uncharacterized protein n=1 Tax=Mythimna separata TaxID=271217 RepID=A0AAD7Y8P2_MYTSE|nr:hypothetical protein PYW07_012680 [Mythimna separata]